MIDLIDLDDVAGGDRPKVAAAMARFRLEAVTEAPGASFDAAWALLDTFFGPRGELEAAEALAGFVRARVLPFGDGMEGHYHLLAAWDGDTLAGVRDCYVDIDRVADVCVVALSHSLVAPAYRRSGLAALFRAAPATLARATLARAALARETGAPGMPIVLAAEMEPVDPDDDDSVVRLLAYGRSGFSVLDPARVPYSQPDFRDVAALGLSHLALPLLPVVRRVGAEDAREMPPALAAAYPRLFHACHRQYLPRERVDPSEVHALRALSRTAGPVPVLPLPAGLDQLDRLAPLLRSAVLPLYPEVLRGPRPDVGDPADEHARLRSRWAGRSR